MFPSIEPFATGHLSATDGNEIYWEASGNPKGRPALYLHGGPGGGMMTRYRCHFDPEKFLIIGFEQRGCGRSRPLATENLALLSTNTSPALIADIEQLREHFNAQSWLLLGVSWGTTLALAYAQAHPDRVSGMVLGAVTTTSAFEVNWITEQMGHLFPREWEQFVEGAHAKPGQPLIDAYYELITDSNEKLRRRAARAWCAWEDVHVSLDPKHTPDPRYLEPEFSLLFATLVIHYWKHAGFTNEILGNMELVSHIPGVLIHGRLDVSSPLETAWRLHKAWPASELVVVETEGHGGPEMADEMTAAISRVRCL